ncbi:S-layer protein, partial [Salmonella enterica]|nr:S-layer protein [Salmonella enterica]
VSADNLREVKVAFDGEVEEATATDETNYTIDSDTGVDVTVKSASLSADKKVVTLTVESSVNKGFDNQKEYTLDVTNVRAAGKVITASDIAFTPVDAALPVVQSAEALGNKAVKLTFSEPVVSTVNSNNFKIDGAAVIGTTNVSGNTVILKLYTALSNAEHTINVSGVADYSGLVNTTTDHKFTVVEDTAAPTVANIVNATFESVTVQFSEPVDPATVSAGNVFWKQGNTERTADGFEQISDTTYKFSFSGDNKLIYATNLFVTGVQDYSGNTIAANTSVAVNPVVDQTRPEVISAKLSDKSTTEIVVKYTKAVTTATATDEDNYVIKDADGDVVSEFKDIVLSDNGKTATITLYEGLSEGDKYTLTISNVADTTTLNNVILPYTADITVGNVSAPTVSSATYASNNRVIVTFDKAMDPSSVSNTANYMYYTG